LKTDKKILFCLYIIIGLLLINTIVLIAKGVNISGETKKITEEGLVDVSIKEALKLFDNNETKILYLGRPDCSACMAFQPTLESVQKEYGFDVYYLNINTVNSGSSDLATLKNKLTIQYTMKVDGSDVTEEFGYFYGYTPELVIIEDGKMKDGIIGGMDSTSLVEFLQKNEVIK